MSLIFCPECGREISEYANVCATCGYPIGSKKKEEKFEGKYAKGRFVVGVLSIILFGIVLLYSCIDSLTPINVIGMMEMSVSGMSMLIAGIFLIKTRNIPYRKYGPITAVILYLFAALVLLDSGTDAYYINVFFMGIANIVFAVISLISITYKRGKEIAIICAAILIVLLYITIMYSNYESGNIDLTKINYLLPKI